MNDWDEAPTTYYQGHLWDAPFTDDAMPADLTGGRCDWCDEEITPNDDAVKLPHITGHLECHLRFALGSVTHLEQRCSCFTSTPDDDIAPHHSLHDEARATLRWLLQHNRGRFKPA